MIWEYKTFIIRKVIFFMILTRIFAKNEKIWQKFIIMVSKIEKKTLLDSYHEFYFRFLQNYHLL